MGPGLEGSFAVQPALERVVGMSVPRGDTSVGSRGGGGVRWWWVPWEPPHSQSQSQRGLAAPPPLPRSVVEGGEVTPPTPLQGAQAMPSHCPPDAKSQPRWRL